MRVIAVSWLVAALALPAGAQTSSGEAGVERQIAAALAEAVNAADRGALRRFVAERYAPEYQADGSADARVSELVQIREWTGGLAVISSERPEPEWVVVGVEERRTGWVSTLRVGIEAQPPHRITALKVGPVEPPASLGAAPLPVDGVRREAERLVAGLCRDDVFSGAVLIARGQEVVYEHACGLANKDFGVPNTTETRFNLASMNKMFTAVAIAQLVEAGRLRMDDPLSTYLPDFPSAQAASRLRIEHLLTHTGGLPSFFSDEWEAASPTRFRTIDDHLPLVAGKPLHFEPASQVAYSNTGFLVLGKVIEVVTGQSYFDYVRERIFRPAGMESSCYCDLDGVNEGLAVGYTRRVTDEGVRFSNYLYENPIRGGPAGGGFSTTRDLLRFARALWDGTLVSPATARLLTTPKTELHADLSSYGYGFIARRGGRSFGHNGGSTGVSVEMEGFRDRGYTAIVLSNYGAIGGPVMERLRAILLRTPELPGFTP
jgi:CubicO group peptidase (beta-lactamase class C family)